jgi:hypothetical protein
MEQASTYGELSLFCDLPPDHLARLAGLLHRRTFRPGASLITAEQPGEVVYIILSGTVKIHVEQSDGTDVIIAFGGTGDVEGEISLLENVDRSANAVRPARLERRDPHPPASDAERPRQPGRRLTRAGQPDHDLLQSVRLPRGEPQPSHHRPRPRRPRQAVSLT